MSQRTFIHKRINISAIITITFPDVNDNDDEVNDETDLATLLDDVTRIQESCQGNYQYILSRDIPAQHKNNAKEYLLHNGWTYDSHLTNPDTGKRGLRGYKKLL